MKLSLFNTLTRKREDFKPIDSNCIKMYVCGPTVYDRPHIGNARSVVVYDVLYRLLCYLYGKNKILYVRNITDIDDKIMDRAKQLSIPISQLTKFTISDFHHDMEYLGCLVPNKEPKATEHVREMINIIERLLDFKIAYKSGDHVYFDVSKDINYTKLSNRTIDELSPNLDVDIDKHKKNPADFVLWKPSKLEDDDSTKFSSPFGDGRPGWHIECSAMSNKFLGDTFDIHGGGVDLIFPHHTNEIAQSTSAFPGSAYAKYWIHNGFLTVNHEKMSKSLGNFVTVKDLIDKRVKGDTARLFLLSTHYRKPLDYNEKAISDAQKTLNYWYLACDSFMVKTEDAKMKDLPQEFIDCLLDDLNTHMAIKIINNFAKEAHTSKNHEAIEKMVLCANFLGLMREKSNNWFKEDIDQVLVNKLIQDRYVAKQDKNWKLADQIRDQLKNLGISIEDAHDGTTSWRKY